MGPPSTNYKKKGMWPLGRYPGAPTDVNKNDFQDKFAGYGIYRFQNLPTNQKEN